MCQAGVAGELDSFGFTTQALTRNYSFEQKSAEKTERGTETFCEHLGTRSGFTIRQVEIVRGE